MEKQCILIADDDPVILKLVSVNLKVRGFDVVTATDGAEALDLLAETSPDLAILDIMMPRVDGAQVCRHIRQTSYMPVMMMSAKAEIESQKAAVMYGADDYVCKPFAVDEMVSRVRDLLGSRSKAVS